jgi:hypothetical protein
MSKSWLDERLAWPKKPTNFGNVSPTMSQCCFRIHPTVECVDHIYDDFSSSEQLVMLSYQVSFLWRAPGGPAHRTGLGEMIHD